MTSTNSPSKIKNIKPDTLVDEIINDPQNR
jgi:hypothetical protein